MLRPASKTPVLPPSPWPPRRRPLLGVQHLLAISIHNLTWGFVKHTKPLVATIAFHDNRLLDLWVAGEGHKYRPSKKEVYLLHESGEVPWMLGSAALEDLKRQNMTGVFQLELLLPERSPTWGLIMLLLETSVVLASAACSVCSSRCLAMGSSFSMRSTASLSLKISISNNGSRLILSLFFGKGGTEPLSSASMIY
ncbi:hypothetical protein ZWY2020_028728 [Hordeum vulgare]|nr:hypothetical protein ZWY2020_028728 [Hordeum vulgare]